MSPIVGTSVGLIISLSVTLTAQERPTESAPTSAAQEREPVLERLVTLDLQDVPLNEALREINRQAELGLAYTARVVPVDRRVTLRVKGITARAALGRVLQGTGVKVVLTDVGTVALMREENSVSPAVRPDGAVGWVNGIVTDSASGEPVANVIVSVKGTALRTTSKDRGQYELRNVTSGVHIIMTRLLGYAPLEKEVTVRDDRVSRVDFALRHGLTRLQEVVTTATGRQRRMEIGNDITVINADSIVRTEPIMSVTDLLEGRVPGLTVQRTSGAPGDPARIRLRGASSPQLSNDPIVVVDGVRVYAEQSGPRGGNLAGGSGFTSYAAPSPLDYIDPHSIETIDVVKGPSAATMYGQDAANGVIVITTKKGREGPPRWTVSAEHGMTKMPGRYPDQFLRWGHDLTNGRPIACPITNRETIGGAPGNACVVDSLVVFQLLNDPELTVLDRGTRTGVALGVSGGSAALTYAINGSYRDEVGLIALPAFEVERYRLREGAGPPDWMERPQNLTQWGATSRLTAQLGSRADVSLTGMLSRTRQRRSSLETQIANLMSTYLDRGTGTYYTGSDNDQLNAGEFLNSYYERAIAAVTQFTNAVNLNWRPLAWLTTRADAGLNVIQRADEIFLPRGFTLTRDAADTSGRLNIGQGTSVTSTVNMLATARAPFGRGFQLQFTTGINYSGESIADLTGGVSNLAAGTGSLNQAGFITRLSESRADQATFGWYAEPSISHKRQWLSMGIRLDGGSSFGSSIKLPSFPKLSYSYLISDEPFFPWKSLIPVLRLRAAYGQAGQQPGLTDRLRLYGARVPTWVDGRFVEGVRLATLGNTQLKPERSREFESGFDSDLLDDRLTVSFTGYRKTTLDALMNVPLALSVNGGGSVLRNIGVTRNTGINLTVGQQFLRSDAVTLRTDLSVTQNRNVVVKLGRGVEPFYLSGNCVSVDCSGTRVAPGYPLFGQWAHPILGYADANGDGVISGNEVLLGDTAVYVGQTIPNYRADLNTALSLMRGAISITAAIGYEAGLTQVNAVAQENALFSRGRNDTSAPLAEQAAGIARTRYGFMQTVSTLRLTSLAMTYNARPTVAQRLGAKALSLSLQGTNLGLRTNYRSLDPNVNALATGNEVRDSGILPQPRTWQLRVNASY